MNLLALATLVGSGLPLVIALVQQQRWSTQIKTIVTIVMDVAAAVAGVFVHGDWHGWTSPTWHAFWTILAGLILGTWGSYAHLWQNLGVTQWIEKVTTFEKRVKSAIDQLPADQRAQLEAEAERLLHPPAPLTYPGPVEAAAATGQASSYVSTDALPPPAPTV